MKNDVKPIFQSFLENFQHGIYLNQIHYYMKVITFHNTNNNNNTESFNKNNISGSENNNANRNNNLNNFITTNSSNNVSPNEENNSSSSSSSSFDNNNNVNVNNENVNINNTTITTTTIRKNKLNKLNKINNFTEISEYFHFIININDIRTFSLKLLQLIEDEPLKIISIFEEIIIENILKIDLNFLINFKLLIGFNGNLKYQISPNELNSFYLNKLICIDGIVTSTSSIFTKIVNSIHYCKETQKFHQMDYNNLQQQQSLQNVDLFCDNLKDSDGNLLELELGLSEFNDFQILTLQDSPEFTKNKFGQLPRLIECICEGDFCNFCKCGDKIRIYGIYKVILPNNLSLQKKSHSSSIIKTCIIVTNIVKLNNSFQKLQNTTTTTTNNNLTTNFTTNFNNESLQQFILYKTITIKENIFLETISKLPNIFDILSNSFAPSIYGHDIIKKSLLLFLISGIEKKRNFTMQRGNLHLLLIGDPSTAKSNFLRFILNIAPNTAISANAKSSSGVGLTASVIKEKSNSVGVGGKDSFTNNYKIQAGTMVLADEGIVCLDELDKMSENEINVLLEGMEQQSVTITKAGLHVNLNARCSILASCNPIYGKFIKELSFVKNCNLNDSLLSRFDLIFILLDDYDECNDRLIANHILKSHQYSINSLQKEKFNNNSINNNNNMVDTNMEIKNILKEPLPFHLLQKYIFYAKYKFKPILTNESSNFLNEYFVKLREKYSKNSNLNNYLNLPITLRTFEGLIRLSTACAKLHFRNEINLIDCKIACKIFEESLNYINGGIFKKLNVNTIYNELNNNNLNNSSTILLEEGNYNNNTTSSSSSISNNPTSILGNNHNINNTVNNNNKKESIKMKKKKDFDIVTFVKTELLQRTSFGCIPLESFKKDLLQKGKGNFNEEMLNFTLNQFHEQGLCVISDNEKGVPTIFRFI